MGCLSPRSMFEELKKSTSRYLNKNLNTPSFLSLTCLI